MFQNKKEGMRPTVLIVLDGWGLAKPSKGNAITLAKTPVISSLWQKYPHAELCSTGECVGLHDHQDGNSEAGHLNLGAGRIVKQDAVYITESIEDGTFFKNMALLEAIKHANKHDSNLHLMGLLSNGDSAHACPEHLYALLELLKKQGVKKIFLHLFTDGRDSPQHAAIRLLGRLKEHFKGNECIATLSGRFYAMDRKKQWDRTEKAYNAMVLGEGEKAEDPEEAILRAYNRGQTDEFIEPTAIVKNNKPVGMIGDNDAIIFFNLRSDRARQLAKVFVQENFEGKNHGTFERKKFPQNICFAAMTDFGPDLDHILTAYPSRDIVDSLPMILKDFGQLYVAEAEKYAHVTYFFNGGYADPVGGEQRIRIASPDVGHYDKVPEMSAPQITKAVLAEIKEEKYDFIMVNFSNPDMIGHTGNLEAAVKAVECVDDCVGRIVKEVLKRDGNLIITADHGNIEEMINLKTNEIDTKHSRNPVPFIFVFKKQYKSFQLYKELKFRTGGVLGDVAPTILDILGLEKPAAMTGASLLVKDKIKI